MQEGVSDRTPCATRASVRPPEPLGLSDRLVAAFSPASQNGDSRKFAKRVAINTAIE
jgi:hypothetical protein